MLWWYWIRRVSILDPYGNNVNLGIFACTCCVVTTGLVLQAGISQISVVSVALELSKVSRQLIISRFNYPK